MDLKFANQNEEKTLLAEVDPTITAGQALTKLVEANFLAPPSARRPYQLVVARTGNVLLPDQSLASAGVAENEVIEVAQVNEGGAECV